MKLRKFLAIRCWKIKDFSTSVGISPRHMYLIMKGKRNTSQRTLFRINHITNGEVATMEDLVDEDAENQPKKEKTD